MNTQRAPESNVQFRSGIVVEVGKADIANAIMFLTRGRVTGDVSILLVQQEHLFCKRSCDRKETVTITPGNRL